MNKIEQATQILKNMGVRYLMFRANHELRRKSGLLKRSFPVHPKSHVPISLEDWRKQKKPFFFQKDSSTEGISIDVRKLKEEADSILNGEVKFFNSTKINLGKDYDWVTNPSTNYKYDANKHWTEVTDYSTTQGDIKFVWEKSRFSYLYTLIRDEQFNGADHAAFIFNEIENWIDSNPINCGPNYRCSQEISLRTLNWIFALYYYANSTELNEQRWSKIVNVIYWQMHHVYNNINFSRIAVRNNHAITETLGLYVVGTLFPWFNCAATWKKKGKEWFEQEIAYQVYEDGTFLQFSMNYHRVLIQLFTLAFRVADVNNEKFSRVVYDRAYKSLNFLFQCQEPSNGTLPNYGNNDGALFFPLNGCDYNDYRAQLNALHVLLCGQALYESKNGWAEDAFWLGINKQLAAVNYVPLKKEMGCISFDVSGYYLIRDQRSFTFIRCGNHKDRPLQADNLHIDIWVNGVNVLHDAGSYKYNAEEATIKYFMGTSAHNTVMLDEYDQMKKGPRFVWYYWTQCLSVNLKEENDSYIFTGSISAFRQIDKNIKHTRKVVKLKNSLTWIIQDEIEGKPAEAKLVQRWHSRNYSPVYIATADEKVQRSEGTGFYSRYYGQKETCNEVVLSTTNNKIQTTIIPS